MTEDYKECGWNNNGNCLAYPDMCAEIDDCEHKQLKRLEQERDELKKTVENQKLEYEELQCDLSEVENACGCYQSENAELKQENKDLKKQIESDKGLITVGGKQQYEMTMAYDKCKSALEEIKHILEIHQDELEECLHNDIDGMIQNRINEVLS